MKPGFKVDRLNEADVCPLYAELREICFPGLPEDPLDFSGLDICLISLKQHVIILK